ncbi:FecR family protein [Ancylomarina salipaludis]|uniref:FecR family protein n=1 Tax=Ancylomarina salipaludis TaxID=2501299 RepID=A0A4Q1JJP0_9BACT|nr:FecR family protein [Ancylomarina salipaludis]RXQ91493.1 FecR family protein [Ancylomarina salipaludis]
MKLQEEDIINLTIDYFRGELSDIQKKDLDDFLLEKEDNISLFNCYCNLYYKGRSIAFYNQVDKQKAWDHIASSITKQKAKPRKLYAWLPYVAALFIIALVSSLVLMNQVEKIDFSKDYNFAEFAPTGSKDAILTLADGIKVNLKDASEQLLSEKDGTQISKDSANNLVYLSQPTEKNELLYNTIDVPRGGEYSLTLSDGTKVWLNAETKLRYPVKFNGHKRDVYLTGEAYFEVAHNQHASFVVHTHDSKVKVLGTKFNVSGYDDQDFIVTTLIEGSVQINNLNRIEILKPGYQSTIIRGKDPIVIKEVDTNLYTSWVSGVYEFENVELEYIMTQLGRWYDVEFFFSGEEYKHIRFTGAFKKENSFEYALNMIERIADVDFAIKGKYIIVGRQ